MSRLLSKYIAKLDQCERRRSIACHIAAVLMELVPFFALAGFVWAGVS